MQWVPITVDIAGGHRVAVLSAHPEGFGTLSAATIATRLDGLKTILPAELLRDAAPTPTGAEPVHLRMS
jgi:hypothetical protein